MINSTTSSVSHRIHGAGIYANIWGILWYIDGIHVTIYSSTMDPMGFGNVKTWDDWVLSQVCCMCCLCRHLRHLHFHRDLGGLGAWEIWPPAAVNGTSRCLLVAVAWWIFSLLGLLGMYLKRSILDVGKATIFIWSVSETMGFLHLYVFFVLPFSVDASFLFLEWVGADRIRIEETAKWRQGVFFVLRVACWWIIGIYGNMPNIVWPCIR